MASNNVILFGADNAAIAIPKAAAARRAAINEDVQLAAQYATMSIKGKVFTLVKDGQSKQLTKTDDIGEVVPVSYISAVVLRANVKARVYYEEKYNEENSAGARPTCFSHDGVAPDNQSRMKQSAKCAICPHAVWGTGNPETGEGTACSPNARLAIASPDKPQEAMLLRVPPASIKSFKEAVKLGDARNAPYNSLVMRISFDSAAPSPKLVFKPVGVLTDAAFDVADKMYENEVVHAIVGVPNSALALAAPAPTNEADELDAALAAREVTKRVSKPAEDEVAAALAQAEDTKRKAAAVAAAKKAEAEAHAKAVAAQKAKEEREAVEAAEASFAAEKAKPAAPAPDADVGGLLGELDGLLSSLDD